MNQKAVDVVKKLERDDYRAYRSGEATIRQKAHEELDDIGTMGSLILRTVGHGINRRQAKEGILMKRGGAVPHPPDELDEADADVLNETMVRDSFADNYGRLSTTTKKWLQE